MSCVQLNFSTVLPWDAPHSHTLYQQCLLFTINFFLVATIGILWNSCSEAVSRGKSVAIIIALYTEMVFRSLTSTIKLAVSYTERTGIRTLTKRSKFCSGCPFVLEQQIGTSSEKVLHRSDCQLKCYRAIQQSRFKTNCSLFDTHIKWEHNRKE